MRGSPTPRAVDKFGGASLADGAGVRRVGRLIAERAGERPIVVVSAIRDATAALSDAARAAAEGGDGLAGLRIRHRSLLAQLGLDSELLDRHFAELSAVLAAIRARGELDARARDHVLSFGERTSARIVAAHLASLGLRAVPVDAFDLGLESDSNHGRARVLPRSLERVRAALEALEGIPVITGFVAQDRDGRLTTLGRNGSDLTASLVGEAVGAREVRFWKDVGGVMTADPELVPDARVLRRLSYAQAASLTRHGAGVLHADSLAPLERAGIPGRVLCVREPSDPGTRVSGEPCGARVIAIASRRGAAIVRVPFRAAQEAEAALAGEGIEPLNAFDAISEGTKERRYVVTAPDEALRALAGVAPAVAERDLATVAAIGEIELLEIAQPLAEIGDDLRAMWGSPATGFVVAVPAAQLARAARAFHDALLARNLEPNVLGIVQPSSTETSCTRKTRVAPGGISGEKPSAS